MEMKLMTEEICGIGPNDGKMKVGQSVSNDALLSASAVQHEAPQGHDGNDAHPRVAGAGKRTPMVGKEGAAMNEHDEGQDVRFTLDAAAKPSLEIDTAKYQAYLDDPSLTNAQKEEIMQALWSIIVAFVDLGFGVHPAQEVCGKHQQELDVQGNKDSNESKPVKTLSKKFERASDDT
ncbi:hypothetical protein [Leisingera sp. NJS204]|uniref:hypothetical protein n=1 Tax=Leisingera sp. NJS204 TaxID=2508307 RepID=UPI00101100ED|nr:hypothetical protein [Leisingera sp. NJS204]QAX31059.1 hypothetical protein ETW24_17730 [Leisingera sp. NJS204]